MKKIYSLLLAFSVASLWADAKTTGIGIPNIFPHMGSDGINPSLPANSRIIRYTYLKHNGVSFIPVDSTTYGYSFGRGGQITQEDMDDNFVNFDDSYTFKYVSGNYRNDTHRWQTFNSAGKAQTYTIESWDTAGTAWKNWGRYVYFYNNDITLIRKTNFEIYSAGQWTGHYSYNNTYDNSNNLVRMNATTVRMFFVYDAANRVQTRIDSIYDMTSWSWKGNEKYDFVYSGSKMISYTVQVPVNGVWTNRDKYEHAYTGNAIDYTMVYTWDNNAWKTAGKHIFTYDGNGNKLSNEWQYWDVATASFISASRQMWTYNTFSQPVTYYSETFEPATTTWSSTTDDFLYRYYYQTFIAASIDNPAGKLVANLYPQPAQNTLNLTFSDPNVKGLVSVFDAHGRVLKTQSTGGGQVSLDVSSLPAGMYFLKLNGDKQQYATNFVVAR